jgi:pimeloyl-ACP methyl ester carboxylesterase
LGDAGDRVVGWLRRLGVRPIPSFEEMGRSYRSLTDADARRAFFRTLHGVVDVGGQAVSAIDRLYLAAQLPTLIVWGAQDPIIPVSHGQAAADLMPGSRLAIFDGVGHYPHCEDPERFVEVLCEFIDSTEPTHLTEARWRELLRSGESRSVHVPPMAARSSARA